MNIGYSVLSSPSWIIPWNHCVITSSGSQILKLNGSKIKNCQVLAITLIILWYPGVTRMNECGQAPGITTISTVHFSVQFGCSPPFSPVTVPESMEWLLCFIPFHWPPFRITQDWETLAQEVSRITIHSNIGTVQSAHGWGLTDISMIIYVVLFHWITIPRFLEVFPLETIVEQPSFVNDDLRRKCGRKRQDCMDLHVLFRSVRSAPQVTNLIFECVAVHNVTQWLGSCHMEPWFSGYVQRLVFGTAKWIETYELHITAPWFCEILKRKDTFRVHVSPVLTPHDWSIEGFLGSSLIRQLPGVAAISIVPRQNADWFSPKVHIIKRGEIPC